MSARRRRITVAASAVALGLALAAGPPASVAQRPQEQDPGPAERAGERLDRVLGRLQRDFRDLSDDVRRRFAEAQQRVEELGVEARVYSRLRWDKALNEADVAVEIQEGNVAVLHGTVADAELRRKAVRLAVETVGVDRVKDNLRVAGAPDGAARGDQP